MFAQKFSSGCDSLKIVSNCESFPFGLAKDGIQDRRSKPKNTMFKNFAGDANLNDSCKEINNSNVAQA